jgi:phage gpG-like protein
MALVRGDFASLKELQRRLTALKNLGGGGDGGEPGRVLRDRLGVALMKEVADEFRASRDPYGNPWKPLAKQRERARDKNAKAARIRAGKPLRKDKILVDTGRMRASVVFRPDPLGLRVIIPVEYASYHQEGTGRMPRRQIVPDGDTGGLGARWTMAAIKAASSVVLTFMKGAVKK